MAFQRAPTRTPLALAIGMALLILVHAGVGRPGNAGECCTAERRPSVCGASPGVAELHADFVGDELLAAGVAACKHAAPCECILVVDLVPCQS